MIVPGVGAAWPVRRRFSGKKRKRIRDAQQPGYTGDNGICEHLWVRRLEPPIEKQRHIDPVLAHRREVASDDTISVKCCTRLIVVSLRRRACAVDERRNRQGAVVRGTRQFLCGGG